MSESEVPTAAPEHPGGNRVRPIGRLARRGLILLASVTMLALTAAGWVAMDRGATSSKVLKDATGTTPRDDGVTDILLVGNDSRTDAQGNPLPLSVLRELRTENTSGLNTDTLILMRVPNNGAAPTAVSIPRDTRSFVPGRGAEKINGVYGLTKTETANQLASEGITDADRVRRDSELAAQRVLVQTVQRLTGIKVDHYAEVNLLGFYEITQAVGGVEVCLREATTDKDSGADFPAGRQTISGGDALAFVRQRHGLPRGDLDRVVRQQVFLASLANKVLSAGTLTDPGKVGGLIEAARRSVILDSDWNMGDFIQRMRDLASGGIRFQTLPVNEAPTRNDEGQYVLTVNPAEVKRFVQGLATPPHRVAPEPMLRLDGTAHRQPITSEEIRCVN